MGSFGLSYPIREDQTLWIRLTKEIDNLISLPSYTKQLQTILNNFSVGTTNPTQGT